MGAAANVIVGVAKTVITLNGLLLAEIVAGFTAPEAVSVRVAARTSPVPTALTCNVE